MDCDKKRYAIREVAEITGIKPVTLRAWQRRYNLVQPQRTEKGHRLYSDEHIALIGEIQGWLVKGVPIGKVKPLLGSVGAIDNDVAPSSKQLPEVETFLQALAELNKAKAEAIVATLLKEYPLEVVEQQFIDPAEKALILVRTGLRSLLRGLMDSILAAKLNAIIEAENRSATLGKCLFVCCDKGIDIHAHLRAAKLAEQGHYLVSIDGVDDLSGLVEHLGLKTYRKVVIYSARPLSSAQLTTVEKIKLSFDGEVLQANYSERQG